MAGYIANATETAIMQLVFQAVAWANYADNAASSPQTNIGIALHTADPLGSGTAASSEVAYTGYTRVNVARSSAAWTVTGNAPAVCSPVANITFPAGTGGSGVVSNFSTSKSNATPPTGTQALLWAGTVSPTISTGSGVTPVLTTATAITLT
jgi:hypothetical protein